MAHILNAKTLGHSAISTSHACEQCLDVIRYIIARDGFDCTSRDGNVGFSNEKLILVTLNWIWLGALPNFYSHRYRPIRSITVPVQIGLCKLYNKYGKTHFKHSTSKFEQFLSTEEHRMLIRQNSKGIEYVLLRRKKIQLCKYIESIVFLCFKIVSFSFLIHQAFYSLMSIEGVAFNPTELPERYQNMKKMLLLIDEIDLIEGWDLRQNILANKNSITCI